MKKKEISVVYILTKLELGGAQKVCLQLLEELRCLGTNTFLITGSEGILIPKVKEKSYVYLLSTLTRKISSGGIELKNFIQLIRILKQLKKEHPQLIIHTHSTKAGILGRWAAFFAGIKPRVHTIHGYAFHHHQSFIINAAIYFLELITSFITTHFICVSSEDVKIGIKIFPRFAKKYSIIRAAVNWKQFYIPACVTSFFPDESPFIFGTISCFKKQKNLFDLLTAFAWVHKKNPHTRLEIIGDGDLRPSIEEWISEHRLSDAVKLHGWQEYVVPIMQKWNTFVLSSLWEGLPCSVIEARLLKLPVLSYNTGGIHDVIFPGENGFLYKQKDWLSLAHGMLSISTDKQLYQRLQSYHDDLRDFNNAKMIQKHQELYNMLSHI